MVRTTHLEDAFKCYAPHNPKDYLDPYSFLKQFIWLNSNETTCISRIVFLFKNHFATRFMTYLTMGREDKFTSEFMPPPVT